MQYTVWIVSPPNYPHSRCFEEVALSLRDGLRELRHDCEIVTNSILCKGRTIVLGAHLLTCEASFIDSNEIPTDLIIYNLEQITPGSPWLTNEYLNLLRGVRDDKNLKHRHRNFEVWDYCQGNIGALAKLGVDAKLCGVGYVPELSNLPVVEEDIDVLFIGSMNPRRSYILNLLMEKGVKVMHAFDCYGDKRNDLIARAKIVLNVHFYPSKMFEIVRCSYLFANKKCVVSEKGVGDFETGGFCEYERLAEYCMAFLLNGKLRSEVAQRGFDIFSQMKQSDMLRKVL